MLLAGCTSQVVVKPKQRPNVLFITTDYMRGADLPATDAPFLQAPMLEKLCNEGAVFTRHSCVSPICMPARATIATGHYPHVHGLWDNRSICAQTAERPFITRDLQRSGYQTVCVGKMHWHLPSKEAYHYDIRISLEGKDAPYVNDDYESFLVERGYSRKHIKALKAESGLQLPRGQSCFDWPLDEDLHADGFVGLKAVETIENNQLATDKPWFMWTSFTGPHNPWNTPKRFSEIYRNMDNLPDADFVEGELKIKPLDYTRHRYGYGGDLFSIYDNLRPEEQKKLRKNIRAAHYGNISFIDEWLSKIVNALEQKGQLDNTIIVFSSDHGSALFDHEMLHKGTAMPTQLFVPFVVWRPGMVKPGKRTNFSTHADVYTTFMELAGQPDSGSTQGQSLVRMLQSTTAKTQDYVVVECAMVIWMMNDDWLVGFHHVTQETDLYDLKADPMCHKNLAEKPEMQKVIDSHHQRLVQWRKSVAAPDETVNENVFEWQNELGDPKIVDNYKNGYTNGYRWLASFKGERPGRTGSQLKETFEFLKYHSGQLHPGKKNV